MRCWRKGLLNSICNPLPSGFLLVILLGDIPASPLQAVLVARLTSTASVNSCARCCTASINAARCVAECTYWDFLIIVGTSALAIAMYGKCFGV